jgi:phosphatidate cytidylyltransferase
MPIKKLITKNFILRLITTVFLSSGSWILFFYYPAIIFSFFILCIMSIMITELKSMVPNLRLFLLLLIPYQIVPCMILIYFNQTVIYRSLLFYLLLLIFCFDSASYIFGKICSKFWKTHKIIPSISPKKSWEGFFGGYIITTSVLFRVITLSNSIDTVHIFILGAIISSLAFAGDIFESYLKRSAKIKDSSSLLPGHGGFLDRFDSVLFVSYFFFIYKNYLLIFLK